MLAGERTRDIYERVGGYPQPPLVPLPEFGDLSSLERLGIRLTPTSRRIVRAAIALTGFGAFWRRMPEGLETLLRRTNLRGPGLFAPVISATLALADDSRPLSPFERAATLVLGARSLYDDLKAGRLPADERDGQPLEMGQYPNLFSTSLIVEGKQPRVFKSTSTSQITVMSGGRIWLLEGGEATLRQLSEALAAIAGPATERPGGEQELSPAILTSAGHLLQLRIWPRLQSIPRNAESLAALRHSFLAICLDLDAAPATHAEAALLAHSGNPGNRWQHSSLQLVVFGNARACAVCNFSAYLDGNTMMRGASEIQRRAAACPLQETKPEKALPPASRLEWVLRREDLERAQASLRPLLDRQQATFEITGIGKDFFDAHGLPAVPAFVVALQRAANRLTGQRPRITQFLSMSRYRAMDLTTAEVTTPEVLEFVERWDRDASLALLRQAIDSQTRECRKARRYLNLFEMFALFLNSGTRAQRLYRSWIAGAAALLLRRLGFMQRSRREILISHPEIYPEIPVVGRPGIRLPYVKYFGLHYQILPQRIVITLMPSVTWTIPNTQVVAELKAALDALRSGAWVDQAR